MSEFQLKVRIQRIDKDGNVAISPEIRELAEMPEGSFCYLKPIGKRRVLIQGLAGNEEFFATVEKGLRGDEGEKAEPAPPSPGGGG